MSPATVGKHPAITDMYLATVGKRQVIVGKFPTIIENIPAVTDKYPAVVGRRPVAIGEPPVVTGKRPVVAGKFSGVIGKLPVAGKQSVECTINDILVRYIKNIHYLNMSNAVLAHFDSNVPVWTGIRIIAEGVGRLRNTLADITGTATRQSENNPVGHTVAKEQTHDGLEDLVYLTALRIRSYAILGINDLLTRSRLVPDACVANLPALTEYQVDQKTVDELQERIDRTAQLYAQRDIVIDQRMEATARLQQLFTQARKQLKTLYDLVVAYVEDDAFLATYFNARRIHDLKGRMVKTEEKVRN